MPPPIGISNGWLYGYGFTWSLAEQSRLLSQSGATAVELVEDDCFGHSLSGDLTGTVTAYVSLHLPNLGDNTQGGELDRYAELVQRHRVMTAVLHPSGSPQIYIRLKSKGLPAAAENLDCTHPVWQYAQEVAALCGASDVPLVLDVQHAYESSIAEGRSACTRTEQILGFVERAGLRLAHLHVSGEIADGEGPSRIQHSRHALVHLSTNRRAIIRAVRSILDRHPRLPIILEGDYLSSGLRNARSCLARHIVEDNLATGIVSTIRREIEFLGDALRF